MSVLDKIVTGELSRDEFLIIRDNALRIINNPSTEEMRRNAEIVLAACDRHAPEPISSHYNFMGFCPGADILRRRDTLWREMDICDFHFYDSPAQMEAFTKQLPGDWIILKKREVFGRTMKLYGFGKITRRRVNENNEVLFDVNWNTQANEIEVPLMGCNATVNMRSLTQVDDGMPQDFWVWLENPF